MDHRGPETSFTSGENGHKIAFDPRYLSETEERSKQPKLTLMEDVLLLGLKDKQVSAVVFSPGDCENGLGCVALGASWGHHVSCR